MNELDVSSLTPNIEIEHYSKSTSECTDSCSHSNLLIVVNLPLNRIEKPFSQLDSADSYNAGFYAR